MVGGAASCHRLSDYLTLDQSPGELHRNKYVIQPQMRIPNRKSVALVRRMKQAVSVNVIRVFHQLNGFALNVSAAQPNERANPGGHTTNIKNLARRKRVEVSNQNMKAMLVSFDTLQ